MANWIKLKKAIADVIKTNGNEEITGAIMQQTLISIVDNLGSNAQFGGVAVPSTVPADTDGSVFYLASTQGTYPNFNNIEVDASEMAVFTKNTAGTWVKTSLPIQHPTIKKPLLIGGNVAAVTKGTGVVLSVPTLNADGTETVSELSIEAATPSNNGTMTKDQVNTLKEVDDFYTRMTDFVIGDNDDRTLLTVETTQQNSINLKYKTLDTVNGSKAEKTKVIPAVSPGNGTAGVAGMNLVHDIPYFFDFYKPGFTSLPNGSDITKVLIPKFQTSFDVFDDIYTDVPAIQNKVFANPKAGDRILIGSLSGAPVGTAPLWATVTSAQRISGVYSVTVEYDGDTYIFAYTSSNDIATLEVPWSKVYPKRNVYINEIKQLSPEDDETRIREYLTPQVYYKYNIVYPVKPQTGDLVMEYHNDELRYVAIKVVRNQENPDEYTDILIPESGTANAYTRIVLKNDLTAVKSRNPYYIFKTCKRAYDGDLLLALDTVKAETIENSITKAYSFTIEGRNTGLAAQLPEVGDLIKMRGDSAPVCEVLLSDDVQHTRWFSKGKLYEVLVNTALTRVPEDPKVVYNSKKIYDEKLLNLGDTTDVAQIKKAFTPKGYAQPVIPDSGDIVQMPDGDFLIFNSVQNDEFYLYIYAPQTANTVITIQCRKDFTTAKTVIGVTRIVAYCYDGNALLDTEITTPSDIELIYTPKDVAYGYKSLYGAEPPKIGDIIIMPTKTSEILARGVVVDAVETDNTYITRWFYGGKLYEAEVTKDFTSIPKYGKVIYDTTSGTLRDLYISAGAVYNEATGFYELNGLTDITEEQMRAIYNRYLIDIGTNNTASGWLDLGKGERTNLPCITRADIFEALDNSIGGSKVEVLRICAASSEDYIRACYVRSTIAVAHQSMPKLKKVIGIWRYTNENPNKYNFDYGQPFSNCPLLEEIRMERINKSHTFAVSPNLSKESVLYMITNAKPQSGAAAGSITITLHPTAYARLKDDADIVAALEAKGGIVTLVSA